MLTTISDVLPSETYNIPLNSQRLCCVEFLISGLNAELLIRALNSNLLVALNPYGLFGLNVVDVLELGGCRSGGRRNSRRRDYISLTAKTRTDCY